MAGRTARSVSRCLSVWVRPITRFAVTTAVTSRAVVRSSGRPGRGIHAHRIHVRRTRVRDNGSGRVGVLATGEGEKSSRSPSGVGTELGALSEEIPSPIQRRVLFRVGLLTKSCGRRNKRSSQGRFLQDARLFEEISDSRRSVRRCDECDEEKSSSPATQSRPRAEHVSPCRFMTFIERSLRRAIANAVRSIDRTLRGSGRDAS